jgi:phosphoribosylformylglycinamidine (FGAM) synthase-like amidotransferase family enzyme
VHGRNDVAGDTVRGNDGDDNIRVRDGEQDVVNCGNGVDTAYLDFKDRIEDATPQNPNGSCEVIQRGVPNKADSNEEDAVEEPAEDRKED